MPSSETAKDPSRQLNGRRFAVTLVLLILGAESTFFHVGGWNQYARLAAAVAFVEPGTPYTGTFRIDGLKDDGSRLATGDWAESNGAFYSNKAPGISFLAVGPYFLLYYAERAAGSDPKSPDLTRFNSWALNLFISIFWNIVAALVLLRRLPRLGVHSREGAALVALVYSCATLVLPFACSAWGHSTAAAFITLGILDVLDGSRARCVLGGLWLGLAALSEYLAAVSLTTAGIFLLAGDDGVQRFEKLVIGSAAPVAALLLYHELAFGSYFTTAASLSNPSFLEPGRVGGLFGVPNPVSLVRMLFVPGHGFFWQTPVLLLSAFGAVAWIRAGRSRLVVFALANIALYTLSISALTAYQGGQTTSMRYLIVAVPFFSVLLPDLSRFRFRKTFLLLFAVSTANMFVLAATNTMYHSDFPLSQFAYPDFFKGHVSFNPLLNQIGVSGAAPVFLIAGLYAAGVFWLTRSALAEP